MNVLIADDYTILRKGLSLVLSSQEYIDKIYEATNVNEIVDMLKRYEPEIAVFDMRIDGKDTLEIIKYAKDNKMSTKFIILTSSTKGYDLERAKKAGVNGYLLKDALTEEILYAFSIVCRGKKFFHADLSTSEESTTEKYIEELTKREKEVFFEVGKGFSNSMIAEKLYISENTVKKHVSKILLKLNLSHRTQVVLLLRDIA
jgi:DNA-binding NarL/FixJ family response regulator